MPAQGDNSNSIVLLKAAYFAADKHRGQTRKDSDGSPYINHPLSAALLIAETGGVYDTDILAAALLHDTLEDTDTTEEELEKQFGSRVLSLVLEVTDDKSLPKKARKQKQIDHAEHLSKEAVLIKLADKITNVRDISIHPPAGWGWERRKEYLDWAEKVIANCPKANEPLERLFAESLEQGRKALEDSN
jgi:guanosine-3',5'-bis(diphosphate) 3'-pyrophosphohydrolase